MMNSKLKVLLIALGALALILVIVLFATGSENPPPEALENPDYGYTPTET